MLVGLCQVVSGMAWFGKAKLVVWVWREWEFPGEARCGVVCCLMARLGFILWFGIGALWWGGVLSGPLGYGHVRPVQVRQGFTLRQG